MTLKVTVLGCSGSNGVPAGGYGWGNCDPQDPKNNRTRPGVLLEKDGFKLVIDAGPDIRHQLAREEIWLIDAVLFTHPHFDHIGGVGDLFGIAHSRKKTLPFYCYQECADEIYERNRYAFDRLSINDDTGQSMPLFSLNIIPTSGPLQIGPLHMQTFALDHFNMITLGVQCDKFAYLIDCKCLDDAVLQHLAQQKLDLLILDGNNPQDNPTFSPGHLGAQQAAAYAKIIGAKKTYISSLPGWHDYVTLKQSLPAGIEPAYDGLAFTLA